MNPDGGGMQLRLAAELPCDPRELAQVPILERARLYEQLHLDPEQREVIEAAVRLVKRAEYGRTVR